MNMSLTLRFFRREYGNIGLGLSISKYPVELTGGELRLDSAYGEDFLTVKLYRFRSNDTGFAEQTLNFPWSLSHACGTQAGIGL